jgi:flagellar basal body-associated protein FliL
MDYNNQFDTNNTPNQFNEPKEGGNGIKSILIGIVSALTVLGLVGGGIWLYNSGKGTSASSSSSSTTTNSGSSKSASLVSSSVQSVIVSSAATITSSAQGASSTGVSSAASTSAASNITLLTFSDSQIPGLSFVYDSALWKKPEIADFGTLSGPGIGGKEVNLRLNNSKEGVTLTIQKFTNTQNVGGPLRSCYTDNQNLDIGGGWFRLQVLNQTDGPGQRTFSDFAPTNEGQDVGSNNPSCPNKAFYRGFGSKTSSYPQYNALLYFTGDNRSIADDIVKSIKY